MTPNHKIQKIVGEYCETFPEQLRQLAFTVSKSYDGHALDEDALNAAVHECHRMGGTAHCMGFRYIGAVLIKLEAALAETQGVERYQIENRLASIEQKLSRVYGFARYVTPKNSLLLRNSEGVPDAAASTEETALLLKDQRILVADDDPSIRALVLSTLQHAGLENVRVSASGLETMTISRSFKPTLLILDWMMDPIDGLEFLKSVRTGASSLKFDTPVIFISTRNETKRIHEVIRNGADYFLLKPFSQTALVNGVTHVVKRAQAA